MTLTQPTPPRQVRPYGHRPVMVQNLTGLPEDVLHAVGWARRTGVLVAFGQVAQHNNGHVTVRVEHTLGAPLRVTSHLDPVDTRDWMDYLEAGLRVAPWLLGGGVLVVVWIAVSHVVAWLGAHSAAITAGVTGVLGLFVLVTLLSLGGRGRSGGCAGLHCGGCRD